MPTHETVTGTAVRWKRHRWTQRWEPTPERPYVMRRCTQCGRVRSDRPGVRRFPTGQCVYVMWNLWEPIKALQGTA